MYLLNFLNKPLFIDFIPHHKLVNQNFKNTFSAFNNFVYCIIALILNKKNNSFC